METVTVVGLGKIGLPLASVFANSGHFNVIGADKNEKVVETLNKGISHISNEPGLDQLLYQAWKRVLSGPRWIRRKRSANRMWLWSLCRC